MAGTRELTFQRDAQQALLVHLAGPWTQDQGVPPPEEAQREIEKPTLPTRICFEARSVERWDSALVAFVDALVSFATARKVAIDLEGLPAGVARLVGLAQAVPERGAKGAPGAAPGVFERERGSR